MTKLIPKRKIGYILDYDPKNPYHVHSNGEKVVITPEQYEKHKDESYFANIRKQVEEHQAAYPGPEYTETENLEYRRVYENVKAASNQHFNERMLNGKTYREYSTPPESYIRNSATGVVTDEQGNLYRPMTQTDSGKGVTPMFTTTERNYRNGSDFDMSWVRVKTPEKTIKTLKQPLPVDRTYNVDEDLDNSVNNYIKNNILTTEIVTNPLYYYKLPPLNIYANWPADVMSEKQLRDWNSNRPKRRRLSEKEIQDKLNSDYGTFNWTVYDPNTRKTKTYNKSLLYKDIPSISVVDFYNTEFQKLSEEQIRNMYKDLQGQTSLLFSLYPTAEDFLNDSNNRLEMITPGKSKLTTKSPTRQQALNNIQLNIK